MKPENDADVVLANEFLRVSISPSGGSTIKQIVDRSSNSTFLCETPWTANAAPSPTQMPLDHDEWIERYPGGWMLLLPNAGARCRHRGVEFGFHGEVALAQWKVVTLSATELVTEVALECLPLNVRRRVVLERRQVTVTDTVRNSGDEVAELIWGHHPSLGGDLLRGGATISLEEADVFVDARLTEGSLLAPGTSDWPTAHTKDGRELDLRTFIKSGSLLCSLVGVSGARVEVARADGQLGATLRWDRSTFPYLWLWEEAGGLTDAPWNGAVEILGLEPASTLSPCGLAEMARGEHTTKLAPGAQVGAWVAISTWRPFM